MALGWVQLVVIALGGLFGWVAYDHRQALVGLLARPAAYRALDRCYGVAYAHELSSWERKGMESLERKGVVEGDMGEALHWHLKT